MIALLDASRLRGPRLVRRVSSRAIFVGGLLILTSLFTIEGFAQTLTPPGKPTGLTATAGDGEIVLSWTAPSDKGTPSLYGYQYKFSLGNWIPTNNGTNTTVTVTGVGLTNGTSYTLSVSARGQGGDSAASDSATATPNIAAPTGLTATAGGGQVTLNWTAVSGVSTITKYQYQKDTEAWADTSATTSHTVTGLTAGTSYTFKVRAYGRGGGGTASASQSATPLAQVSAAPVSYTLTAGDGQIRLNWGVPLNTGTHTLTHYEYAYTTSDTTNHPNQAWTSTGSTSTSYTLTGLTNGITYSISIRAVSGAGNGTAIGPRSATPQAGLGFPPPSQQVQSSPADEPETEQPPPKRRIRYECPVGWTRGSVFGKTKKVLIYELKVEADTTNTTSIYQLKSLAIYVHPDENLETLDGWTLKVGTLYNQFGKEFKLTSENSVIDEHDFAHIENTEDIPIPMGTLGYIGQSLPSFDYRLYDATGVRVDFGISCYKAGGLMWRLWNTKDPRLLRVLPLGKSEEALSVQMKKLDWNIPFFRSEWTAAIMPDLPDAPAAPSQVKKNVVGTWADLKKQ